MSVLAMRLRTAAAARRGRPAPAATFGYPVSLELTGRTTVVIGEEAVAGGKVEGRPVVVVRGYAWRTATDGAGASALVMEPERDLFP